MAWARAATAGSRKGPRGNESCNLMIVAYIDGFFDFGESVAIYFI